MLQRFFTGCDRPKATASAVTLAIPFMLAWLLNMAMTFVLEPASAADPVGPSFTRDIKSLLSNRCLRCHGPDAVARQGGGDDGLRLDTFAGATADLNGHAAIVPGHPDKSAMIVRMTSSDPDFVMPPPDSGDRLSPKQIDTITHWIALGAIYEPHWAYQSPRRPPLPMVKHKSGQKNSWAQNDIDRFIEARLEAEHLVPQPEAPRAVLARRLALDLIGLPLTPEEIDLFVANQAPDAVEKLVDRLLAHTGYGEHQARQWLDLARYADSAGYADDPLRTIWGWRDWVVNAFDSNMPFDEFTIKQIAGDLLTGATLDDKVATAFHRNTLTNSEGGTIDEEFRSAAIVDRVNTTMSTWMGTTISCCQCHDHKYDPLSQRDYFGIYAILNNTSDADRPGEEPIVSVPWGPQAHKRAAIEAQIMAIEACVPPPQSGQQEPPEFQPTRAIVAELRRQLTAEKPAPTTTVPVLEEVPHDRRRITKLQHRGNYQDLGAEVAPGVPGVFPQPIAASEAPMNRIDLARWLVDPRNPLTARVVVNRIWERLFGIGLVATSEEFGSQGDLPSHPELLDWLAVELIERDWDMRAITRLIVTSATYRQSSKAPADVRARDPENRLLACGPRVRLSAETIRDQALAASGLLSLKKGGPSVNPPQPKVGLTAAFGGSIDWKTSGGEDRYRRALYTTWRRSNPYPSMTTFDAPNREVCTVRRPRTNTPLQALVTLNDPVFVEASQALARRMLRESAADGLRAGTAEQCARRGFRLVLARQPLLTEVERLIVLQAQARQAFEHDMESAKKMATDPIGEVPRDLHVDIADLAAWTVVANVILNLDEAFMCP